LPEEEEERRRSKTLRDFTLNRKFPTDPKP
jgi:hypothetical protein